MYVCVCVHVHMCMCAVHVYVCSACVYMYTHVCMSVHVHICVYMYVHVHTHIHMYTHTHMCVHVDDSWRLELWWCRVWWLMHAGICGAGVVWWVLTSCCALLMSTRSQLLSLLGNSKVICYNGQQIARALLDHYQLATSTGMVPPPPPPQH